MSHTAKIALTSVLLMTPVCLSNDWVSSTNGTTPSEANQQDCECKQAPLHQRPVADRRRRLERNLWLLISLVVNLGLLGYFKYTGFLLEVGSQFAEWFGIL